MKYTALLVLLIGVVEVRAAVPSGLSSSENHYRSIFEALRLPMDNRIQVLKEVGGEQKVAELVFDRKQNLSDRWRAMTVLPYLDKGLAKETISKAMQSQEWYIRNAALVAVPALDRQFALDLSLKYVADPALVVRTAAVQNISKLKGKEAEDVLWRRLNSRENFHNGESLWIRRHIVKALAEFAKPGKEANFVALLNDKDERLHPFAIRALEKITGQSSGKLPLSKQREKWLAWKK